MKRDAPPLRHVAGGSRRADDVEYLVIHGLLRADLTFEPLACRSAFSLRPMRTRTAEGYSLELRDEKGKALQRAPVAVFDPVVCHDRQSDLQVVHGRIALREGATHVRLLQDDILIHERAIPDAPSLSLGWEPETVGRGDSHTLSFDYSKPSRDAYLVVYFQWGARTYRPVALLRPQRETEIRFDVLPGGDACRLIAAYTSGMRTAVATTGPFSVPLRAPLGRILSPASGGKLRAGRPVTLEGQSDGGGGRVPEGGGLVWRLGGREIGRGRVVTVAGLPAGKHAVALFHSGSDQVLDRRELVVV